MLEKRYLFIFPMLSASLALTACTAEDRSFGNQGGAGGQGEGGGGGVFPPAGSGPGGGSGCSEVEDCFDGIDSDCDGQTDCEDSDCDASVVCVPAPTNLTLGVLLGTEEPCPEGFTADETLIYRNLVGGACAGCSCSPNPTDCKADLWYYTTAAACTNDVNKTGGNFAGEIGFTCTMDPINSGGGFIYGARTAAFKVGQSCAASGTAAPEPASFSESLKFCHATKVGKGCGAGKACVPKEDPLRQCALTSGSASCEGYGKAQNDWFTGYNDTRSCSSCSCVASGGTCGNVTLFIGSDYVCNDSAPIQEGQKWCGQKYSPPARLQGDTLDPSCTVTTTLSGSLDPTGQSTICCVQ